MSKWVCEKCGDRRCTMDVQGIEVEFDVCLVDGWKGDWVKVKETSETPESARCSLPTWCEVGEWVWFTGNCVASPKYLKIDEIKEEDEYVVSKDGKCYWISQLKPARLRPYNVEELQNLVGIVVRTKDGDVSVVGDYNNDSKEVYICDAWYNSKELAESEWLQNGLPCGALEHLVNGDWM